MPGLQSILTYKVNYDRCIPFKYRSSHEESDGASEKILEVLMVSSASGPGLVFPKVRDWINIYHVVYM